MVEAVLVWHDEEKTTKESSNTLLATSQVNRLTDVQIPGFVKPSSQSMSAECCSDLHQTINLEERLARVICLADLAIWNLSC